MLEMGSEKKTQYSRVSSSDQIRTKSCTQLLIGVSAFKAEFG